MGKPTAALAASIAAAFALAAPAYAGLAVAITSPTANASVTGSVAFDAAVVSGSAREVDFYVDGQQRAVATSAPYAATVDASSLAPGAHTFSVRAVAPNGRAVSASETVTVPVVTTEVPYSFGDPTYGVGGWLYDGTSRGWIRQYPAGYPQRVTFDPTVVVAPGWPTIEAEVQPNDPTLWGGQRAQVYSSNSLLSQYGAQPSLGTTLGSYRWYAFEFETNSGYRPQSSQSYPNWNSIFSWHDTGCGSGCSAPQANVMLNVATAQPNGSGSWSYFTTPKLDVEVYGGDPANANWWSAGHRWYTVDFVPGKKYLVQMGIRWGANGDGSIEVWINGVQVVAPTTVSDVWQGMGVYPVFENYRPASSSIGNQITWTNDVYYAGLASAASRADASMP